MLNFIQYRKILFKVTIFMITWMQKHKKYLVVTIWISTIAFVGAGFVGWGEYKYGDKASAIAKVGDISISLSDLQSSYGVLFTQYKQMFGGEFDEEKAQSFGLKRQALEFLKNQALVLNLAKEYDLDISEQEVADDIFTKDYFFKNGVFDKEVYQKVLSDNHLSKKEYEQRVKKELLIKKTISLLPVLVNDKELKVISLANNIADKIEYKVLKPESINIETSDEVLKPYWENIKTNFMSEASYDVKFVKLPFLNNSYNDDELKAFYDQQKELFRDKEGKILTFEESKEMITKELNLKESKKEALKSYVAFKKGEIEGFSIESATISESSNNFSQEVFEAITKLTKDAPFSKPILVGDTNYIFELVKLNAPEPKSYEDAKKDVVEQYKYEQTKIKLAQIAKDSLSGFKGSVTDFITKSSDVTITDLNKLQVNEFLNILFLSQKKEDSITLSDGSVILYRVLEQKMLNNTNSNESDEMLSLKSNLFNEALIKALANRYKVQIFIEGL